MVQVHVGPPTPPPLVFADRRIDRCDAQLDAHVRQRSRLGPGVTSISGVKSSYGRFSPRNSRSVRLWVLSAVRLVAGTEAPHGETAIGKFNAPCTTPKSRDRLGRGRDPIADVGECTSAPDQDEHVDQVDVGQPDPEGRARPLVFNSEASRPACTEAVGDTPLMRFG